MTLTYRGLKDGEIRLVTIITDRSDPFFRHDMICCRLEHFSVSEDEKSEEGKDGGRVKGCSRVWDTDSSDWEQEEMLLLRKHTKKKLNGSSDNLSLHESSKQATSQTSANIFEEDSDNELPWRFTWGDYIALSYLWGPVKPETDVIALINGAKVPIRENLAAALLQLKDCPRIKQGFKLWVDMLCINQRDLAERGVQVGRMKDIYASAWQVVVWLGVEANGSDLAMSTLRYLSWRHRNAPSSMHPDLICQPGWRISTSVRYTSFKRDVHVHLYRLLTRDYWYRLWVLQEIALGSIDMPILCGNSHIKWSDIVAATKLIQQNEYGCFFNSNLTRLIICVTFNFPDQAVLTTGFYRLGFWMATDWALFFERKGLVSGEYGYREWQKADVTRGSVRNREWCRPEWRKFADLADLQQDQSQFILSGHKESASNDADVLRTGFGIEYDVPSHGRNHIRDEKFWKALLLGRLASATNPRDKIYGLLGLSGLSALEVPINYDFSPEEVFIAFARSVFTKSRSLSLLRFSSNPIGEILRQPGDSQSLTRRHVERHTILSACGHVELPSWAPCWICDSGASWETQGYHAGTSLPFAPTFETKMTAAGEKRAILILQGVKFDLIENLSAFHAFELDQTFPYNSKSPATIAKPSKSTSSKGITESVYPSISEALWRTLVANRSSHGSSPAPESYSCILSIQALEAWQNEFLASDVAYWLGKTLTQFRSRNKALDIFGTRLGDILKSPSLVSNVRNGAKKWADAASCARKTLEYRRLVTTRKGYLGVVPAGARSGDVVAILAGAEMVVILRPVGENQGNDLHRVVGLGYVHGLMDTEVMDMLKVRKVEVQDIKLC